MPTITEGQLSFDFPEGWLVAKFDDWSFYRHQFLRLSGVRLACGRKGCGQDLKCVRCGRLGFAGVKAIDILAIEGTACCWCIEIKDYRLHGRTKTIDLADEIAMKVRDSLAALAAAAANANDHAEKTQAASALACQRIRIVLHLEQPTRHSKQFPRAIDPADVLHRLKQLVKAIDPHPLVVESTRLNGVSWSVKTVRGK